MKKTRGYARKPFSIEDGLKYVIEKIGDKGLREATGKGYKTFYKQSNPRHPNRDIKIKEAIDIDIYCRKKGMGSPLLDCYKTMLDKVIGQTTDKTPEKIHKSLLQIVEELGDVSSVTREALEDGKVNEKEREQIAKEVREVEVLMADLKQKLDLGEKNDYSKWENRAEDGLKSK